jgi:hypothetical protein
MPRDATPYLTSGHAAVSAELLTLLKERLRHGDLTGALVVLALVRALYEGKGTINRADAHPTRPRSRSLRGHQHGLLRFAIRLLPSQGRSRYSEEWCAELHELDSSWKRVQFSVSLLLAAPRLAWVLRASSRKTPIRDR